VAVAGASGFVGRHLVDRLCADHDVIALGRSAGSGSSWRGTSARARSCDLFSLRDAETALQGVDVAYYLVHSMMPTARLTQARFEDMDAIIADNFGRAAALAGVKQIVYLGGLIPSDSELSKHLESREEVETLLGAHGVSVTVLRAGLVVGKGGSSLDIMTKLVQRLPVMVCPSWTDSRTQPIALSDVVELLARCAGHEKVIGRVFDVGGSDVLTYREMMRRTAEVMGVKRTFVSIGMFTPGLSTLWVSLVTGSSRALVGPLVQSLKHPMVAENDELARIFGVEPIGFEQALRAAFTDERPGHDGRIQTADLIAPVTPVNDDRAMTRPASDAPDVRSIQRLHLDEETDAISVASAYLEWLPHFCRPWLRVDVDAAGVCKFMVRGTKICLLELSYSKERSSRDRALLYITSGVLALIREGDRDRLEFRMLPGGRSVLAAIHDFTPALPWFIYKVTQAQAHLIVMRAFGRHLRRRSVPENRRLPSP
jgi:uncharacterized protein YbjT (DUF2867 family)